MNTDPTASPAAAVEDIEAAPPSPCVELPQPTGEVCGNCGAPLFGEHCYHCGQPDHGLVRHFSSVMGDLADTVLQIDTRITRTLAPLLLRPGYLSREYFAGRRVRYVSPVRLFFFISVVAFVVAQWSFDASNTQAVQFDQDSIESATTIAAVEQQRDAALKAMHAGASAANLAPGLDKKMAKAELKVGEKADARIAEIKQATAEGKPVPVHEQQLDFGENDKPWDPVSNPIHVASLPAFVNGWFNQMAMRTQGNIARIQKDPNLLMDAWLSAVPSTLFLLLPLFAFLLKLSYLFKRRLYMEHFIVALHSHAFLCLALLLALLLNGLEGVTTASWMHVPIGIAMAALIVWMPLYLWLMQKRVYAQGWIMTTLKFWMIGTIYIVLLSFGAAISLLVKLVWL